VLIAVCTFIRKLKLKIKRLPSLPENEVNLFDRCSNYLLRCAQREAFPTVVKSLSEGQFSDPLVLQLNLFLDETGLVRVQSKLRRLKADYAERCPILLSKSCPVAKCIILDTHVRWGHAGLYKLLSLLRQEFWITNAFVVVKRIVRECVVCRRMNQRSIR
jgi:hypothetical protein